MEDKASFDWVSFYEELAKKLLTFRNKQKELISVLKTLNIAEINKFLTNEEKISPFSVFEMFNRQNSTISQRKKVIVAFRNIFTLKSEIPESLPSILKSQKSDYFETLQKRDGLTEISWNLLEAMFSENEPKIIQYYDDHSRSRRRARSVFVRNERHERRAQQDFRRHV